MAEDRSSSSRIIALAVGALLIIGGATSLGVGHRSAITTISAAASLLAGLMFLRAARRRR